MFTDDVNAVCINAVFSAPESRMHESMSRLLDCAKKATKEKRNAIHDFRGLGAWMGESAQTVNNWKSRGLSKEGALKAASLFNCNANWLLDGQGEPGKAKVADADNIDHALDVLTRAVSHSDKIAKLSLELLIAVMERKPVSSDRSATQTGADNGRKAPTDDWGPKPLKTSKGLTSEQSIPVPHKRQKGDAR